MPADRADEPLPPLRRDLETIEIDVDGTPNVLLRDPAGYAPEMLQLSPEAWVLATLFDGGLTASGLSDALARDAGLRVPVDQIRAFAEALETNLFLSSPAFHAERERRDAEWAALPVRRAAFAGQSYPGEEAALRAFLSALIDGDDTELPDGDAVGVIAPHIDLQIGPEVYAPAWRMLSRRDVDTIVVFGTSHYSDEDLFILTEKTFETPLGSLPADVEFVRALRDATGHRFTAPDTAFRMEHSIEFQALFTQHLFGGDHVRFVPVLCTSFEHFLLSGADPISDERYAAFIEGFRATVERLGRRVGYVMSVDWSHVGRKFGDENAAARMLDSVRASDRAQLDALAGGDHGRFSSLLRASRNATSIDGYSCITTFFDIARPRRGALLKYDQWHEVQRESAVTYASMAFFQ